MAKIFYTPPGYSGTAQLTAANGLEITQQGLWQYSKSGFNDGATFGLSLTYPNPLNGGELRVRAQDWSIAVVGNTLTSYTNPDTSETYPASQCRIQIVGEWQVTRQPNSNSFNSIGVSYLGHTHTDLGNRDMGPVFLLNYTTTPATYKIQGANVTGGAQNTFSNHEFYVHVTESVTGQNSNREFQSNSIVRPVFVYTYAKSWEIDV